MDRLSVGDEDGAHDSVPTAGAHGGQGGGAAVADVADLPTVRSGRDFSGVEEGYSGQPGWADTT